MNKAFIFGIIAIVALLAAGCVSQGGPGATATPQASVAPGSQAVSEAQVNAVTDEVDTALADMDMTMDELSDFNSQDMNSSVIDAAG